MDHKPYGRSTGLALRRLRIYFHPPCWSAPLHATGHEVECKGMQVRPRRWACSGTVLLESGLALLFQPARHKGEYCRAVSVSASQWTVSHEGLLAITIILSGGIQIRSASLSASLLDMIVSWTDFVRRQQNGQHSAMSSSGFELVFEWSLADLDGFNQMEGVVNPLQLGSR
jgi:hypothetical protein